VGDGLLSSDAQRRLHEPRLRGQRVIGDSGRRECRLLGG
jgi:hypothetical protein